MAIPWTTLLNSARTKAQDNGTTKGVSSADAIVLVNGFGRWLKAVEPPRTFIESGLTTGLQVIGTSALSASSTPTNWAKIHRLWNAGNSTSTTVNGKLVELLSPEKYAQELDLHRQANGGSIASDTSCARAWARRVTTSTGADQGKWIVFMTRLSDATGYYLAAEVEYDWTDITGSGTEYIDLLPNSISLLETLLAYEIARLNNRDPQFLAAIIAPFERDPMIVEYFERERVAKASRPRG